MIVHVFGTEKRFVSDGLLEYVEYSKNFNSDVCIRYADEYQYLDKYNLDVFDTSYCKRSLGFDESKIIQKNVWLFQ